MLKFGKKTKKGSVGKQSNEALPLDQDDAGHGSPEDRVTPMPSTYSMPSAISNFTAAETNNTVRPVTSARRKNSKKTLPPLFLYIEAGDFQKAVERARHHPREARTWASIKIKSSSVGAERQTDTTKRLALHQACFKVSEVESNFSILFCFLNLCLSMRCSVN